MSEIICFDTGCDLLNEVIGGGLYVACPAGKILNIVADKSAGKTALALEIMANAYHKRGKKLKKRYDNAESGLTHDTKEIYNMELTEDELIRSKTVEEFYCNYRTFLESIKKGESGIYIMDSLDGLSSDEIEERGSKRIVAFKKGKTYDKGSYQMGTPKFLSQEFFRGLTGLTDEKNCLLIVVSQTRDAINSMFAEQKRSGGKALDFYAFCCLWLSNVSKIKKQDRTIGVIIKAHAKKSKTPRPYRECVFPIYFTYGIDNIGANLDFLYDLRGDNFKLLKTANSIAWGSAGGKEISIKSLKAFFKENQIEETYKNWSKDKELSTKEEKIDSMVEFIDTLSDTKDKFKQEFGQTFTRDELIKYIEQNNLQSVLTEKVKVKWEAIEKAIELDRPKKYQ